MKIIICPDSFKGSATSKEVASYMTKAAEEVFPTAKLHTLLMADGGEGTVDAIAQGSALTHHTVSVEGPFGEAVEVTFPITSEGVAILEMASASGITLSTRRDPLEASSIGFGQLIRAAVERGAKRLVVGIGGSATNDGGMGMLIGLGAIITDKLGNPLIGNGKHMALAEDVDLSTIPDAIRHIPMGVICDVTNPLLGENGATAIYGPQKGVTPDIHGELEAGMAHFASKLNRATGNDHRELAGAGAAGGVGFALATALNATLSKGIDLVLNTVGFDKLLNSADLIITGEGCIDRQSVEFGKVPSGITQRSRGVPVLVVVGGIGEGGEGILKQGNASIVTTVNAPMSLEEAMERTPELIYSATRRGLELVRMGIVIGNRG